MAAGRAAAGVVSRTALLERLRTSARVTMVSAPPGSGKTVLLRSWVGEPDLANRAAWVMAAREERDPQRFWLSVVHALRGTAAGSVLVQPVLAAPGLDGWALVERLLTDLAPLDERLWLVIDDVHELGPDQALRQLELLVLRAPPQLRFVLAARHEVRLGLHRLRLDGQLTEIRVADLRFTPAEAQQLFAAAGVELSESAAGMLHERTEGWAAGLRMAALSLAGHPEPERFAEEFSGSERTVAEYLLAEVLDRVSDEVRLLLLRTAILERVNGELADLLTGSNSGERILQDLEQANAFVVSLDAARTWFRYHQMFAGLLALELRRTEPEGVGGLHHAASAWFTAHGYPVEAIRHAQAAPDWDLAAGLLADHWPSLYLDGQAEVVRELLAGFPRDASQADARLLAIAAAGELEYGSVEAAEQYLGLAERATASVPRTRPPQAQLLLGIVRLVVARQRGNVPAVAGEADRLQAMSEALDTAPARLGEDLRGLALLSLAMTEYWTSRFADADRHLDQAVELAGRIGRPFLEFSGLAYKALSGTRRSFGQVAEDCRQVIDLARRHGWADEPPAALAYGVLGGTLTWRGQLGEAEAWVQRAERTLRAEAEPAQLAGTRYIRGALELARGHDADALAALQTAERVSMQLAAPHFLALPARVLRVRALVRVGESEQAAHALAELDERQRDRGEIRAAAAALHLAHDDPCAAIAELGPVLDGSAPVDWLPWSAQGFILEAIARDTLGDQDAARRALERALDLAEPDGMLLVFLLDPAPDLLERHSGYRTAHAALIADILSLLRGVMGPGGAGGYGGTDNPPVSRGGLGGIVPPRITDPLLDSEIRVLRYLPTNLTLPEIARELHVSHNTVKTHIRSLFTKLGAHRRAEAVDRARALGLLAPAARRH